MEQLSPAQRDLVSSLARRLGEIRGVRAVVLGGSYARGLAGPASDIDLGILYSQEAPFSISSIRELAEAVNDATDPVVTGFYEWGPWVNGGAWLTIGGQRVDLIYRSIEHIERVISEAEAGRYEVHYAQQPPFGFFSGTYLGEVAVCVPVLDPTSRLHSLKKRVAVYPEAMRRAVVQDYIWMAEFGLGAFARKFAARSDVYGTAACLTSAVNQLVLALFALNRQYLINDKTALAEIAGFQQAPRDFGLRVQHILGCLGTASAELLTAVDEVTQILKEAIDLTGGLYRSRYTLS